MDSTQTLIIGKAKELLSKGTVDLVIGYESGSLPLRTRPSSVRDAGKTERLVWNSFCSNNLSVYLPPLFRKPEVRPKEEVPVPTVGLFAKGCDARSAVGLILENQVPREKLVIIGIPCKGMVDPAKIERQLGDGRPIAWSESPEGMLEVGTREGSKTEMSRENVLLDACLECANPMPECADVMIQGEAKVPAGNAYASLADLESGPAEERWRRFSNEISKCIRCYACRQACPNCFCKTCFADQSKPQWIGSGLDSSDVVVFHLIRIFHQAGRCVECDACVRACPAGIDLRAFNRKLGKEVKELFDFVPGLSTEELPPLCTFRNEDKQDFLTEP